ncbi:GNAT family N-acetyltransferase [Devosia sp. A449]
MMAAMQRDDVPAVAALFYRAFRGGGAPSAAFLSYLERSFFTAPSHDPAVASMVHRDGDGIIDAALLVIPMQVRIGERVLTGRLMSNYMTDPRQPTRGGANMVLTLRARHHDFCFSDSANPVSADHWRAIGGHVLPVQSLDWRRVFRPAGWLAQRMQRRVPGWLRPMLGGVARGIDTLLRRLVPGLRAVGPAVGTPMARDDFIQLAPGLVERFALHPVWGAEELGWLLEMAAQNPGHGKLHLRELRDGRSELAGCSVFYARPGGMARVLNILSRPGQEAAVVGDLLAHLDTLGCLGATGLAQPFLMAALGAQKGMVFVPRGAYCISTRHAEITDAALRGDAYLGGLMGEDWSRLLDDFHD